MKWTAPLATSWVRKASHDSMKPNGSAVATSASQRASQGISLQAKAQPISPRATPKVARPLQAKSPAGTGTETNTDHSETGDVVLGGQQDDNTTTEQVLHMPGTEAMKTSTEALPGIDSIEAAFEFDMRPEGFGENTFDGETAEE